MAIGYEQLVIVGNVGSDPELRYTQQGKAVCDFSVAVNKWWKDGNGQEHTSTKWYKVTAWGKLGEICAEYVSKGMTVTVIGTPDVEVWIDKESGEARSRLKIVAKNVFFGGSAKSASTDNEQAESEDLPF